MKLKSFFTVVAGLFLAVVAFNLFAQEYKLRPPTPDEDRWEAGVFDYTFSTNAGNQAISTRGGRFLIASNASSAVITNSAVTTNAIILAQLVSTENSNAVTRVTSTNGSFTVAVSTTNSVSGGLAVKFFILNY